MLIPKLFVMSEFTKVDLTTKDIQLHQLLRWQKIQSSFRIQPRPTPPSACRKRAHERQFHQTYQRSSCSRSIERCSRSEPSKRLSRGAEVPYAYWRHLRPHKPSCW